MDSMGEWANSDENHAYNPKLCLFDVNLGDKHGRMSSCIRIVARENGVSRANTEIGVFRVDPTVHTTYNVDFEMNVVNPTTLNAPNQSLWTCLFTAPSY